MRSNNQMKYLSFLMLCVIVIQHQARAGCTWNTGPVTDLCKKTHPFVHLQNTWKNENGKRRCVAHLKNQWSFFAAFGVTRTWIYSGACHPGYDRFYTQKEEWKWCCFERRLQQQLPAKVNTDVSLATLESVRSRQINPPAHLRGAVNE